MTDPTAEAAKLLPCPTFWVVERFENERSAGYWIGGNSRGFLPDIEKAIHFCRREDALWTIIGWHWGDVKITEHVYIENSCPEPAPPADAFDKLEAILDNPPEPNEELKKLMQSPSVFAPSECEPLKENAEHITRYIAACIRRGIVLPNADAWADALQRVADGLAARPKVEDAEVAELATKLRRALGWSKTRDGLCLQAADLLERLASELVTAKGGWEGAMDKWDHALNAGALLKAKLAKREAELARVDGFLILGWTLDDAIAEHPDDGIGEIAEKVKERHAARQQQKA